MLKKLAKQYLPKKIVRILSYINQNYFDGYSIKSYSQEAEDIILNQIFENKNKGFYVDVGAHHPKRFSNTYLFYQRGWSGVNIDAMPNSMKQFDKLRPHDINIEKPVSEKKQILTYYAFNEPALNGFSKEISKKRENNTKNKHHVIFTKEIETTTLEEILDSNLPKDKKIDFLSVDVEGLDFNVLKSNNFQKYHPSVIVTEIIGNSLFEIEKNPISQYLKDYNYVLYCKSINSVFFIDKDFLSERFKIKYEDVQKCLDSV
jgi:FkbM family methyltransferase